MVVTLVHPIISFKLPATLVALSLTLISLLSATAALAPDEVFGLKWGAAKDDVKAAMSAKNQPVVPKYTSDTRLVFSGGMAAGIQAEYWDCCFVQGKLYRVFVTFKERPGDPEAMFNDVKKVLTEKYGERQKETYKPDEPLAVWTPPDASGRQNISISLYRHTKSNDKRLRLEYKNLVMEKLVPGQTEAKSDGL